MTEAAVWLVLLGVLIALAAFLGKWTQSQQPPPAPKKTKSEKARKKKEKAPPQDDSTSVEVEEAPVSKKEKKKNKKQAAKKAGGVRANGAPKQLAGDKKGKSRAGGVRSGGTDESELPTITQQLAGRAETKSDSKKKKKVDFSAFHPYFNKKEKKVRAPSAFALQYGLLYRGTEYSLEGCINDLKNVHNHFLHHAGFHHDNIILMTDDTKETPTKRNMESSLKQFVDNSMKGDRLFVQYSGHGTEVKDKGGDEKDGFDEAICPLDGGVIVDDWLFFNVVKALEKTGASLFVLVDACHSGTCLDLHNQYYATRGDKPSVRANLEKNPNRKAESHVIGFSAAMDNQTATDIQGDTIPQGAFTEMFLEVFKQHMKRPLTYRQFILAVDGLLAKAEYAQQASMSSSQKINLDHECRFWLH